MLWRNVGHEVVLASPSGEGFEVLTGAGGQAWRALETARSAAELTVELAAWFANTPARIGAEVDSLLTALHARGLVERADDG
ncbi:MAG TPA: PqqD family peptide modification chaperone [Nitriliruptorales bacterium]|nr:PqqD family peptide modification chaperone [Nitriliruptorales bacterium]